MRDFHIFIFHFHPKERAVKEDTPGSAIDCTMRSGEDLATEQGIRAIRSELLDAVYGELDCQHTQEGLKEQTGEFEQETALSCCEDIENRFDSHDQRHPKRQESDATKQTEASSSGSSKQEENAYRLPVQHLKELLKTTESKEGKKEDDEGDEEDDSSNSDSEKSDFCSELSFNRPVYSLAPVVRTDSDGRIVVERSKYVTEQGGENKSQGGESKTRVGKVYTKLFGDEYSEREGNLVIAAGGLLAFNSGYVNGACLSGLLTITGETQSVAGFTGAYTNSALALASGDAAFFGFQVSMILSFILGSCISGILTPDAKPYQIEPSYGPTFLVGGVFLTIASVLAALDDQHIFFFFAAAANGIQNGMTSIYSANLIRSTHLTGTSTDIGLFIGQLIRGNKKNKFKLFVLIFLATSFWLGGLVSLFATSYFAHFSLLFNAGLFILIGVALVYFLVAELSVSVRDVICGNWTWKTVVAELEDTIRNAIQLSSSRHLHPLHHARFFDSLQYVKDGDYLDADGLHRVLADAGIDASVKDVKSLIMAADMDGDGKISKEEWMKVFTSNGTVDRVSLSQVSSRFLGVDFNLEDSDRTAP